MRALFLLLVLANLVFFAYAHITRESNSADSTSQLQVSPEKIKLMKAAAGPVVERPQPSSAKAASAAPSACVEWGVFAGPDVTRADAALARLELPQAQVERSVTDAGGYWVYIPPLRTKADADRKTGELKALGIADFFVVQDAGQWRNAISLGIFRTDDAAKAFLAKLRDRGVRSATVERRENFLKQIAFFVREPSAATVAKLAEIQQEFPGSEIKAGQCPPAQPDKG